MARVSEVLHLAPRSVRDLIYSGRLPSVRVGRLHYIKATDLDLERRRRLALPVPGHRTLSRRSRIEHAPRGERPARARVDPTLRRQRAAERAALVSRWAHQRGVAASRLPGIVVDAAPPHPCDVCGREGRGGRMLELAPADGSRSADRLCLTCGRRALLDWADRRGREAAEARRLARSLAEAVSPAEHPAARAA